VDWRLAMRSAQLSTMAMVQAAALFERGLVMRKADCVMVWGLAMGSKLVSAMVLALVLAAVWALVSMLV
jgi:hypothetical protein